MNNEEPINKPLVIISAIIVFFLAGVDVSIEPDYFEAPVALLMGVVIVLISPLFAIWIKALWNNIIPRVTSWRKITFIETLGLMVLAWLLIG